MSLSWRERVGITLAPGQVTLERRSRGFGRAVRDRKAVACAPTAGLGGWLAAVEALREILTHPNTAPADATIVLSNHFVRYLLLPWNAALAGAREEAAFAAARFVQVYGEAAQDWKVRVAAGGAGEPALAAAVERPLLEAVTAAVTHSPLRLRALRPALMQACNPRRRALASDAWIACAEPGRLLLGLRQGGQWRSLRARPLDRETPALAELIEQERLLLGQESPVGRICLHEMPGATLDVRGLDVERWTAPDADVRP